MKAAVVTGKNEPFLVKDVPQPEVQSGKVLVKLYYAALNHRDVWIRNGQYKGVSEGLIPGSDGAGVVWDFKDINYSDIRKGMEVIICPGQNWGDDSKVQQIGFRILGSPDNGTFSEYLLVDPEYVFPKPKHLNLAEAAALPLAALTAWRALYTRGKAQEGQKFLITGIGGGVSQFLLQFAVASNLEVYVASRSESKINLAKEQGAKHGYLYTDKKWLQKAENDVNGGFDLIMDSVCGKGFSDLIDITKPGGSIVVFGGTAGLIKEIVPAKVFWRQINILGSTMGTVDEFKQMLNFYEMYELRPTIDSIYTLTNINHALYKMEKGEQTGKILLKIQR